MGEGKRQEVIVTKQLVKRYGKYRGIEGIDLTVKEGDFFGFIGPNGAGKSTTIRVLLGLIKASSGEAYLFGKDALQKNELLRSDIGYLPSEISFYRGMKVKDVIRLSAKLQKKNCEKEAKELCERLSLDVNKKVEELSLGNRKKVGIVCTMQHHPKLYIMDEPTSGLDPLAQKAFFDLLEERNKEGATIFFSSHVLSEIQRHCNQAAIIREGKLIVSDSMENLSRTNAKKVQLYGVEHIPTLEGMKNLKQNGKEVSFFYQGDIHALLTKLQSVSFEDVTIAEPDLEEIFMHYYVEN